MSESLGKLAVLLVTAVCLLGLAATWGLINEEGGWKAFFSLLILFIGTVVIGGIKKL